MAKLQVWAGIYEITSPSGKVYVGQSWNLQRRFRAYAILKCQAQRKLYNSLFKYGWEAHKKKIIHRYNPEDITQECLNRCEIEGIEYNKSIGKEMLNLASGGSKGRPSEETRELFRRRVGILNSSYGKKRSKEFCESRRGEGNANYGNRGEKNPNFGKKQTEERRLKTAGENNYWYGKRGEQIPFFGKKRSAEEVAKRSGKNHPRARSVIDTTTGKIYDTVKLAAIDLNIKYGTLMSRVQNDRFNVKYYNPEEL